MNPPVPLDNAASGLGGTDRTTLLVGISRGHERSVGGKERERELETDVFWSRVLVTGGIET